MKDKTPTSNKSGIIYSIDCMECNRPYIGQTGRNLSTRIKEHVRDCTKERQTIGLAKHIYETGHTMKFSEARCLRSERNKYKREFLEAVEIMSHETNLNIYSDFNGINSIYCNIVQLINVSQIR